MPNPPHPTARLTEQCEQRIKDTERFHFNWHREHLGSWFTCQEEPCRHVALIRDILAALSGAEQERDAAYERGVHDVLRIRCMAHRNVPQYNTADARGGECAACAVEARKREVDVTADVMRDLDFVREMLTQAIAHSVGVGSETGSFGLIALRNMETTLRNAVAERDTLRAALSAAERERDEAEAVCSCCKYICDEGSCRCSVGREAV